MVDRKYTRLSLICPYSLNIANVFYLTGFIESWGRGIEKICEACKVDDLPMPEFTINPGDIMVKFTAPEDRVVYGPGKVNILWQEVLELYCFCTYNLV